MQLTKKFYAVKKGRKPGIYVTWEECKRQVNHFSGAEYKSFPNEDEALAYIGVVPISQFEHEGVIGIDDLCPFDVLIAYTDGSFSDGNRPASGYGVCYVYNEEQVGYSFGPCKADIKIRNIGGELAAATVAIKKAAQIGADEIIICHDLQNIQMWGEGLWKCNIPESKKFKKLVEDSRAKGLTIMFGWVKGHSGHRFNEAADKYAAQGAKGYCDDCLNVVPD